MFDGDIRAAESGSWLQPTIADYYLQRLPVLHRQTKAASVLTSIARARSVLHGASFSPRGQHPGLDARIAASAAALNYFAG